MAEIVYTSTFGRGSSKSKRVNYFMTKDFAIRNKTARSIRIACGLFFILFCFFYLFFQAHLLEMLQKVLSDGQTSYSARWGTWIITLVLCLVQFGISRAVRLPERCHALTYLPSFLLLACITDFDKTIYEHVTIGHWSWIVPLSVVMLLVLSWMCRRLGWLAEDSREQTWPGRLLPNGIILFLLCASCVSLGNTDEVFHYETTVDAALLNDDYGKALDVGASSPRTSRELTVMRTYALSRAGSLPDALFNYPQCDASRGLLFEAGMPPTTWFKPEAVYSYLGDVPRKGESVTGYLRRLCHDETGNEPALDYYLCALLLRKELDIFAMELNYFCYVEPSLPRVYQEALFLYYTQHPDQEPPFDMSEFGREYLHYQLSPSGYQHTYWYYYDHTTICYE